MLGWVRTSFRGKNDVEQGEVLSQRGSGSPRLGTAGLHLRRTGLCSLQGRDLQWDGCSSKWRNSVGPTRPLPEAQGHLATWKEVSSGQGWQDGAGDDFMRSSSPLRSVRVDEA